MKNINKNIVNINTTTVLPEADVKLLEYLFSNWKTRCLSKGHRDSSIETDIFVVRNMSVYIGSAPWNWSESDFENYSEFIGVTKGLALATQRKYQCAIKKFFEYVVGNTALKNRIIESYGIVIHQICHPDNSVPHIIEREMKKERTSLTHNQISTLFESLDLAIEEANKFHSKSTKTLQRDKVLWYLTYIGGLRISEVLSLKLTSFEPNPAIPEMGNYGFIKVWGKGSNGSGKKFRYVPVTHPHLPALLEWYVEYIRPYFLAIADPNEEVLFLSERGTCLKKSTAIARFHLAMYHAGLEDFGFTPHCLRHSSVTHEMHRFSLDSVRRKHGHAYASTTQMYMHISDEWATEEINNGINSHINRLVGTTLEEKK